MVSHEQQLSGWSMNLLIQGCGHTESISDIPFVVLLWRQSITWSVLSSFAWVWRRRRRGWWCQRWLPGPQARVESIGPRSRCPCRTGPCSPDDTRTRRLCHWSRTPHYRGTECHHMSEPWRPRSAHLSEEGQWWRFPWPLWCTALHKHNRTRSDRQKAL